ncbi:hypothetical protein ACOZB4_00740 [Paenibacillus sp. NPDC058898]|uniref:hypothetical protein n=1 Tax=Paenibacillus sp. NPDC058898 TaxID=3346669 RepID=UPI003BF4C572
MASVLTIGRFLFLQYVFHTLGTKAIDGAEIRTLSPGNPHEHDLPKNGFLPRTIPRNAGTTATGGTIRTWTVF